MCKIIGYDFEIDVFENVEFFCEAYELVVADRPKNDFEMRHHFEGTIEFVRRKLLFNEIINNGCHDIGRISRGFVSFNQGC